MIKIGVVGLGYWGPNLVRVFAESTQTSVTAVADWEESRRQRVQRKYPTIRGFASAEELIASDVDAVVVATSLAHHFPIALKALRAGKHVLVEKPFTSTSEEAMTLIAEAAQRDLILMVDHTFAYNPAVVLLKKMIDAGELGDLLYFDSQRINLGLFQPDCDVIWDLAVHDFAILHFLSKDAPSSVSAVAAGHLSGHPDNTAFITLRYANSFIAHFNVNWLSPVKVRQLIVGGRRQMVIYDDLAPGNKLRVYDSGVDELATDDPSYRRRVDYRTGDMRAPYVPHGEPLVTLAEHFAACIHGKEKPRSGGDAGLHVVRLLEAARQSVQQGGLPVTFGSDN